MDNESNKYEIMERAKELKELKKTDNKDVVKLSSEEMETESDYKFTRKKLISLIETGEESIEQLKEIAYEAGEPRMFEVLAQLIKNTGDLSKSVIENNKIKNDINKNRQKKETHKYTQNNNKIVFAGSTKELADMISGNHEDE